MRLTEMSKAADVEALLKVALHDLHGGELAARDRLPTIAEAVADEELGEALSRLAERSSQQAEALAATGRLTDGPGNLWMRGVLDDAVRDTESVAGGAPLDVALIGAMRKMLAAKLVSYETAIALAERLHDPALTALLQRFRNEEAASDCRLSELLAERTLATPV